MSVIIIVIVLLFDRILIYFMYFVDLLERIMYHVKNFGGNRND